MTDGFQSLPCPNAGLSKHSDPMFPHFCSFFGTIIFAGPIEQRMWFVALCRLQEGWDMGGKVG